MTTTQKITTVGRFTVYGIPGVTVCHTKWGDGDEWLYPLTTCCQATGKGMEYETGVGCRACYEEVDSVFGAAWTVEQFRQEIADRLIAWEVKR